MAGYTDFTVGLVNTHYVGIELDRRALARPDSHSLTLSLSHLFTCATRFVRSPGHVAHDDDHTERPACRSQGARVEQAEDELEPA